MSPFSPFRLINCLSVNPLIANITFSCTQVAATTEQSTALPNLDVTASASFPESEVFGIKLINGRPTKALLEFQNNEKSPVTIAIVGGNLHTTKPLTGGSSILRNITSTRFDVTIPASEKKTLTYSFTNDLHPQDLRLTLWAIVTSATHEAYQINAFNGTISVVEAATSFFDPQMYVSFVFPYINFFRHLPTNILLAYFST